MPASIHACAADGVERTRATHLRHRPRRSHHISAAARHCLVHLPRRDMPLPRARRCSYRSASASAPPGPWSGPSKPGVCGRSPMAGALGSAPRSSLRRLVFPAPARTEPGPLRPPPARGAYPARCATGPNAACHCCGMASPVHVGSHRRTDRICGNASPSPSRRKRRQTPKGRGPAHGLPLLCA